MLLHEWFWSRVNKTNGCWNWARAVDGRGYGQTHLPDHPRRKRFRAHRVAWELTNGPIPSNLLVCHHCDNRSCVRPDHLFLGTPRDNIQDAIGKGRFILPVAPDNRGSRHGMSKLTEAEVLAILEALRAGIRGRVLAHRYNISEPTISAIKHGNLWRHVHEAPAVAGTGP